MKNYDIHTNKELCKFFSKMNTILTRNLSVEISEVCPEYEKISNYKIKERVFDFYIEQIKNTLYEIEKTTNIEVISCYTAANLRYYSRPVEIITQTSTSWRKINKSTKISRLIRNFENKHWILKLKQDKQHMFVLTDTKFKTYTVISKDLVETTIKKIKESLKNIIQKDLIERNKELHMNKVIENEIQNMIKLEFNWVTSYDYYSISSNYSALENYFNIIINCKNLSELQEYKMNTTLHKLYLYDEKIIDKNISIIIAYKNLNHFFHYIMDRNTDIKNYFDILIHITDFTLLKENHEDSILTLIYTFLTKPKVYKTIEKILQKHISDFVEYVDKKYTNIFNANKNYLENPDFSLTDVITVAKYMLEEEHQIDKEYLIVK